jgi:multifunctional methyltransferase subunit TRM112
MKLLTTNFLTCAVKQCRGTAEAYPLNLSDIKLEIAELDFNPAFLTNILPRIEWPALVKTCAQLGNTALPAEKPEELSLEREEDVLVLKSLHNILLEVCLCEVCEGELMLDIHSRRQNDMRTMLTCLSR